MNALDKARKKEQIATKIVNALNELEIDSITVNNTRILSLHNSKFDKQTFIDMDITENFALALVKEIKSIKNIQHRDKIKELAIRAYRQLGYESSENFIIEEDIIQDEEDYGNIMHYLELILNQNLNNLSTSNFSFYLGVESISIIKSTDTIWSFDSDTRKGTLKAIFRYIDLTEELINAIDNQKEYKAERELIKVIDILSAL